MKNAKLTAFHWKRHLVYLKITDPWVCWVTNEQILWERIASFFTRNYVLLRIELGFQYKVSFQWNCELFDTLNHRNLFVPLERYGFGEDPVNEVIANYHAERWQYVTYRLWRKSMIETLISGDPQVTALGSLLILKCITIQSSKCKIAVIADYATILNLGKKQDICRYVQSVRKTSTIITYQGLQINLK